MNNLTVVDQFWSGHTVLGLDFHSAQESLDYLKWRSAQYPLFREFMKIWSGHTGEVIMDYGCGPANDIVGFLVYSGAKKVIGVDVSDKALEQAHMRINLHGINTERYQLIHIKDSVPTIPLPDASVDYIYSEGVLHHTSYPQEILKEFHRVLTPGGTSCIMIYNRNSIWYHLYIPYAEKIIAQKYATLTDDEAFTRSTDTENCPIARCYTPEEFIGICDGAGFTTEYVGGYFSMLELELLIKYRKKAVTDGRLDETHRSFLRSLSWDDNNYPLYQNKHTGIGGVYSLVKKK